MACCDDTEETKEVRREGAWTHSPAQLRALIGSGLAFLRHEACQYVFVSMVNQINAVLLQSRGGHFTR